MRSRRWFRLTLERYCHGSFRPPAHSPPAPLRRSPLPPRTNSEVKPPWRVTAGEHVNLCGGTHPFDFGRHRHHVHVLRPIPPPPHGLVLALLCLFSLFLRAHARWTVICSAEQQQQHYFSVNRFKFAIRTVRIRSASIYPSRIGCALFAFFSIPFNSSPFYSTTSFNNSVTGTRGGSALRLKLHRIFSRGAGKNIGANISYR